MTADPRAPRVLKLIATLVPARDRDRWLREWEGEFAYHLRHRSEQGARSGLVWRVRRLMAAGQHAIWLRWSSRRSPGRTSEPTGVWSDLAGDIKYAVRGWRRSPGFSVTVMLTLTFGLGLAAAIFSFADGYLFRPLPFPGGDRTYYVFDPHAQIASALKASDVVALRHSAVAGYGFVEWSVARTGGELVVGDLRVQTFAYQVSPGFRQTLALPLVAGRDFVPDDHVSGASLVAWLSHRFWQREFGGDRGVVGRAYRFENRGASRELRVAGILGPEVASFDLNNEPPDIVVPEQGPPPVGPNQLAFPLVLVPPGVSVDQATERVGAARRAGGVHPLSAFESRAVAHRRAVAPDRSAEPDSPMVLVLAEGRTAGAPASALEFSTEGVVPVFHRLRQVEDGSPSFLGAKTHPQPVENRYDPLCGKQVRPHDLATVVS